MGTLTHPSTSETSAIRNSPPISIPQTITADWQHPLLNAELHIAEIETQIALLFHNRLAALTYRSVLFSSSSSADPLNFTDYEAQIAKTHEHLRDQLARIKAGGHDVDAIEAIRVRVKAAEDRSHQGKKGSGSNSKQHEALPTVGELASVIVRGRNVVVMVGEKENLKPVLSALQNTPNLNPQHMAQSPNGAAAAGSTTDTAQHINIPVPPTTTDSRTTAAKLAHEKGETAHFALREARGAQKKKLRAMQLAKRVGPDALRRAEKEMEKINEAAGGVVKRLVEEARRRLERN